MVDPLSIQVMAANDSIFFLEAAAAFALANLSCGVVVIYWNAPGGV